MSFTNQTTHYGLPQWIGSDKPTYLVDQNNAYQTIDSELYNANTTAGAAQTAAEGAVATAGTAASTAASAVETAQAAQSSASGADTKADSAISQAQAAQTAAGAAQAAAQAAQEAAAGNSITNLAPAYDPTITYAVDDLVTAEAKLYKCIVAVSSPEQFDINKWDDVTTSEVYARVGAGGDVYTKAEADAKFETQTHASSTFETIANVTAKNNLKLAVNGGGGGIRFGIDGNGNYGYVKDGADTVYPFRSAATVTGTVTHPTATTITLNANKSPQIITIACSSQSGASSALQFTKITSQSNCTVVEIGEATASLQDHGNAATQYLVTITGANPSINVSTAAGQLFSISYLN